MRKNGKKLVALVLSIFMLIPSSMIQVQAAEEIDVDEVIEAYFKNGSNQYYWGMVTEELGYDINTSHYDGAIMSKTADGYTYSFNNEKVKIVFSDIDVVFDKPVVSSVSNLAEAEENVIDSRVYQNYTSLDNTIQLDHGKEVTSTLSHTSTTSFSHGVGVSLTVSAGVPGGIFGVSLETSYNFTYTNEESDTQEYSDSETIGGSTSITLPGYSYAEIDILETSYPASYPYTGSAHLSFKATFSGDDEDADAFAREEQYCEANGIADTEIQIGHSIGRTGYDFFAHAKDILAKFSLRGSASSNSDSFTWDDYDTDDSDDTKQAIRLQAALSMLVNGTAVKWEYGGNFIFTFRTTSYKVKPAQSILSMKDIQIKDDDNTIYVEEGQMVNITNLIVETCDTANKYPYLGIALFPFKWYLEDSTEFTSYTKDDPDLPKDDGKAQDFFNGIIDETECAEISYSEFNDQYYIKGLKGGETTLNYAVLYNRLIGSDIIKTVLSTEDTMNINPIKVVIKGKPEAAKAAKLQLSGEIPSFKFNTGSDTIDLKALDVVAFDQYGAPFEEIDSANCGWKVVTDASNEYSLDGSMLTVLDSGIFKVYATYGSIVSATGIEFRVDAAPKLASIAVSESSVSLYMNGTYDLSKLNITGKDQYGEVFSDIPAVTFKSEKPGTYFDLINTTISPKFVGTSNIWAECFDVDGNTLASGKIPVSVKPAPYPAKIEWLDNIGPMYLGTNSASIDLKTVNMKVTDQYGNPYPFSPESIIWTIGGINKGNKPQATLTNGYALQALRTGNFTVSASIRTGSGTSTISVLQNKTVSIYSNQGYLNSIQVVPKNTSFKSILVDESRLFDDTFNVFGYDQFGVAVDLSGYTLAWGTTDADVTISSDGSMFAGAYIGTAPLYVTATNENNAVVKSNEFLLTINELPVLSKIDIILTGSSSSIKIGETNQISSTFEVLGYDQFGASISLNGFPLTWSSSNENVSITADQTGFTGVFAGNSSISVSATNEKSETITSNNIVINAVKESEPQTGEIVSLLVDGYAPAQSANSSFDLNHLTVYGVDKNGNTVSLDGYSYSWSVISGGKFIIIDGGILYYTKKGTGEIYVSIDGQSGIKSSPMRVSVGTK